MITGAIIGAVGSIINRGVSIFETRQQAKIDEKKRSDELELARLNAGKEAITASYAHDSALGGGISQWVANIRALVRPSITAYSLTIMTVFFFFGTEADRTFLIAMTSDVVTMVITWWFADRFKR